jgi:cell division protein FtsB
MGMNGGQIMVVLIVAIVMLAGLMKARHSGQRDRHGRALPADNAENDRLRDEVKQLKDRLAVLERITVEKENSLAREIEQLRDR